MWPEVSSTDQNEQKALESHLKSRALSTAVKCPDQVGAGEPSVGQGQQTGSKMSESGTEGFCGIQGSWRDKISGGAESSSERLNCNCLRFSVDVHSVPQERGF